MLRAELRKTSQSSLKLMEVGMYNLSSNMRWLVGAGLRPPANAGDAGDAGSIPGLGRSPRGGHGSAVQYSCLRNPTESQG